ncbi:unnamed protein product (macronuclear) [Paramecium tetraurelia]|uniref:Uncharacterized protein n=1 Tax=Paramecium tetraurelia TaxID=5888 RepID=A0CEY0_PARTE|nr:uncharacterized protein GSPATT00037786001 [Paramecium tetraurelia]CAK69347.1 unnamed protein product [Paramecium tetraurelia]|eukprot:XP_001436744.1 hypothetical protein (macronuclear) [Paramecium tetraurelia strain d4-2]
MSSFLISYIISNQSNQPISEILCYILQYLISKYSNTSFNHLLGSEKLKIQKNNFIIKRHSNHLDPNNIDIIQVLPFLNELRYHQKVYKNINEYFISSQYVIISNHRCALIRPDYQSQIDQKGLRSNIFHIQVNGQIYYRDISHLIKQKRDIPQQY